MHVKYFVVAVCISVTGDRGVAVCISVTGDRNSEFERGTMID